ncbi:hypothetical protein Bccel_0648 [Pseudobacteroides cellulosolvens ATCC 35603 = DSM 2933]|uniref:Uncharacterized protein n=1 Tax=Pseudobacteroides cellulosolvens ATCC 35603 = DSM 2933 TaxID=398512 RepID=A0A0L6JI73_9FIRM|nr:hypothetical protein Bccel_0648 [Pseudobacteroides cellulosolvens ATCC 35603 = DSM 2933]
MYRITKIFSLLTFLKNTFNNKKNINVFIIAILSIGISIFAFYLVSTNEKHYKNTIAKITSITEKN